MAQMQAKGRLTGEEVRQFVNAGWNPLRQIADMYFTGNQAVKKEMTDLETLLSKKDVTIGDMAEAEEQMRKRKISADMVFEALRRVTDEGGRFYGNQIRQSQTLTGVFTTMKDRIKMTLAQMLMAFSTPLKAIMRFIGLLNFDGVIKGIKEISLWMQASWQWFVQMTDGGSRLGFLSEAFGDLRDQIRDLLRSKELGVLLLWTARWFGLLTYVALRFVQVGLLGAARLVQGFRMLLRVIMFIQGFFMFLVRWFASAPAAFQPMWEAILDVFELVDYYGNKMVEWLGAVDGWVASIVEFLKTAVQFVMDLLNDLDAWLANTLGLAKLDAAVLEILNKLWEGMTGGFDGAMDYVMKKLMASVEFVMRVIGFVSDWVDKRTGIITAGKRVVTTAGSGVTSMMQDLKAGWENAGREVNFSRDELIKSAMASQTGMATDAVKRTVEAGKTTTNINNKTDFKVDVKGDPNAKTGLTAGEVAMLAEQAARATFSIGLEQALEATI
jgi:hypothetical protein